MKRVLVLGIIALLAVSLAAVAADTSAMGVGKTQSITFSDNVKVGSTVLKAGEYRVKHEMDGSNHMLVFRASNGKEAARVPCTMVELPKKADQTLIMFDNASGEKSLSSIIFRNDNYKHQL